MKRKSPSESPDNERDSQDNPTDGNPESKTLIDSDSEPLPEPADSLVPKSLVPEKSISSSAIPRDETNAVIPFQIDQALLPLPPNVLGTALFLETAETELSKPFNVRFSVYFPYLKREQHYQVASQVLQLQSHHFNALSNAKWMETTTEEFKHEARPDSTPLHYEFILSMLHHPEMTRIHWTRIVGGALSARGRPDTDTDMIDLTEFCRVVYSILDYFVIDSSFFAESALPFLTQRVSGVKMFVTYMPTKERYYYQRNLQVHIQQMLHTLCFHQSNPPIPLAILKESGLFHDDPASFAMLCCKSLIRMDTLSETDLKEWTDLVQNAILPECPEWYMATMVRAYALSNDNVFRVFGRCLLEPKTLFDTREKCEKKISHEMLIRRIHESNSQISSYNGFWSSGFCFKHNAGLCLNLVSMGISKDTIPKLRRILDESLFTIGFYKRTTVGNYYQLGTLPEISSNFTTLESLTRLNPTGGIDLFDTSTHIIAGHKAWVERWTSQIPSN